MSRLLGIVSAVAMLAISANTYADQELAQGQQQKQQDQSSCAKPACTKPKPRPCPCEPPPEPCCCPSNCDDKGLPIKEKKLMKSQKCQDPANKCCDLNDMIPQAYSMSAAIITNDDWAWDIGASFIYWQVAQEGMDVAFQRPNLSTLSGTTGGDVLNLDFGYNPGFKVNTAWDTDFDGWVLGAQYTWLYQTQDTDATTASDTTGEFPGFWQPNSWFATTAGDAGHPGVAPDNAYASASAKWRMDFNQLDLTVSRPYYHGHHLTVTPTGGARFIYMTQKMNVDLTGGHSGDTFGTGSALSSNNHQTDWAVGPMVSMDAHWNVWKGFRFETKAGASVLYTSWTTVSHEEVATTSTAAVLTSDTSTDDYVDVCPTVDMGFGIGFGSYFWDCRFYGDLAVRYDFSVLFNQNVMRLFAGQLGDGSIDGPGNLTMQGLTIDLNFAF